MKTNQKTMSVIIECYANNYSLGGEGIRRTRNGVRYNTDLERPDVGTKEHRFACPKRGGNIILSLSSQRSTHRGNVVMTSLTVFGFIAGFVFSWYSLVFLALLSWSGTLYLCYHLWTTNFGSIPLLLDASRIQKGIVDPVIPGLQPIARRERHKIVGVSTRTIKA
jgi:hypothetical protein